MKKANVRKRILAFFIDHIIYTIILVVPFAIFVPFDYFYSAFPLFLLIVFLTIPLKDIFNGRSIGKRIFGLYVRNYEEPEKTPKLYSLLIRNLLLYIWPIEFLVLINTKDGRRLGDKFAKTQVVEN